MNLEAGSRWSGLLAGSQKLIQRLLISGEVSLLLWLIFNLRLADKYTLHRPFTVHGVTETLNLLVS